LNGPLLCIFCVPFSHKHGHQALSAAPQPAGGRGRSQHGAGAQIPAPGHCHTRLQNNFPRHLLLVYCVYLLHVNTGIVHSLRPHLGPARHPWCAGRPDGGRVGKNQPSRTTRSCFLDHMTQIHFCHGVFAGEYVILRAPRRQHGTRSARVWALRDTCQAVYLPPFAIRPRKPVLLHVLCGENSGPPVLIQYFRASAQDFCPLCGLPPPPETHLLPRQSFWLSPHSIPRVSQCIPDMCGPV